MAGALYSPVVEFTIVPWILYLGKSILSLQDRSEMGSFSTQGHIFCEWDSWNTHWSVWWKNVCEVLNLQQPIFWPLGGSRNRLWTQHSHIHHLLSWYDEPVCKQLLIDTSSSYRSNIRSFTRICVVSSCMDVSPISTRDMFKAHFLLKLFQLKREISVN